MKKIVIIEPGYLHYQEEKSVLAKYDVNFVTVPINSSLENTLKEVKDADAVMVRDTPIRKDIITGMKRCKIIVRYGVGVDNVDLEAAKQQKIYVANVPDYGAEDVAEHALALLLAATRRLVQRDRDIRVNGKWGVGQLEPMTRLEGKILGIIGFGRIAKELLRKSKGIGFSQTLVADPLLTHDQANEFGVVKVEIDELCRQSDFISLHVPLLPTTRHIINAQRLALMKPTTVLVNCGRGGLIDEQALAHALSKGHLFAAGIDTFETEPVPKDNPLLKLDNTICTDHTAWFTTESVVDLQRKAAEEILRVFDGFEPKHWVNK
ncbi:C-terminal binding protein [Conservatibacter flavescens]|uniref:C-terminal binding protein n=1 Tax=Conservatibacter flavescens TaxID=28161 RepID=A0A2M8S587_9PAST|nr:C-terminal binding protein [Conservatibacter flavescens]PJG86310.1 C-terminal binding protein [Conservatibacter flavescens]